MINNDLFVVFFFWGVWLAIPILVDGVSTVFHLWLSLRLMRKPPLPPLPEHDLPRVSLIIPAYNEQENIDHCLLSLRAQTYPHHLLEIIVVNDGSEDETSTVVLAHTDQSGDRAVLRTNSFTVEPGRLGSVLNLVRRKRDSSTQSGKASAVNAGLAIATGQLIVTIDSDVVLDPQAIEQAVRAFLADKTLLATTGHLVIDSYLVYQRDLNGAIKNDERGVPVARQLTFLERSLTACQFIEYVTAFHLGRRSESAVDGMFTLSGACAVFRPEVFTNLGGYRARTVSEDTDMTMSLHNVSGQHVGYLNTMRVHIRPILTLHELFSQRTRWQRGALEATAVHLKRDQPRQAHWFFWNVILPLRLQVDHTLAFPRLVWTFLIFMLPLFGYSWGLILQALTLMFLFYLVMNTVRLLVAYMFSSPPEKVFVRKYIAYLPLWPFYNAFLFWVRVNAEVKTLTESAKWTTQNPLLERLENLTLPKISVVVQRASGFIVSLFH